MHLAFCNCNKNFIPHEFPAPGYKGFHPSSTLSINDTANGWLDRMMPQMAKAAGATEKLKARDQMAWVGLMNCCKAQMGEIIFAELIMITVSCI